LQYVLNFRSESHKKQSTAPPHPTLLRERIPRSRRSVSELRPPASSEKATALGRFFAVNSGSHRLQETENLLQLEHFKMLSRQHHPCQPVELSYQRLLSKSHVKTAPKGLSTKAVSLPVLEIAKRQN
jgi:hypothetical protein